MFTHSADNPDPYLRPATSLSSRARRFLWQIVWATLFRMSPRPFHGWRVFILRRFGAQLGRQNLIYPTARIWAPWLLKTEAVVTIGADCEIYNPAGILLEHHAVISQGAYLIGATHDYNDPGFPMIGKPSTIGAYAWICARAMVMPGVNAGVGAVLGAGAVATRDLEPWGVYAGNPARRVKARKEFDVAKFSNSL